MATCLSSKYNLPIKVCGSNSRGFYMQLYTGAGAPPELDVDNLPSDFMKISKNRNTINFSTADLLRLNDRAQEATKEIYVMTNVVVNELIKDLRSNIGCLYKLAECVSMLDMLHSFAKSCTLSSYVRPEFTDTLAVKQSRHPILDIISFNLVPNNIFASRESNFILITGPNMSGKTTYLKQVALLQIMAQVGSFVPAVYASFRVTSQIFSRVGSDDDISSNSSTFMLEMRELSYVLQNVSSNCLVIVDELGRGTSNEEGFGICHAVCEHLLTTKTRLHVCNVTD
ncbi:MutS protein homolog 4 [Geodia barretti]|uniref:MutS protein homolog 4 n=2 Tax=Geodia barretti TaxID=519541 RepID=A0AA35TY76_GEOBA|nr:MutS protein homolog 4 [Geodia barretti]